jgi:hypothetical protein
LLGVAHLGVTQKGLRPRADLPGFASFSVPARRQVHADLATTGAGPSELTTKSTTSGLGLAACDTGHEKRLQANLIADRVTQGLRSAVAKQLIPPTAMLHTLRVELSSDTWATPAWHVNVLMACLPALQWSSRNFHAVDTAQNLEKNLAGCLLLLWDLETQQKKALTTPCQGCMEGSSELLRRAAMEVMFAWEPSWFNPIRKGPLPFLSCMQCTHWNMYACQLPAPSLALGCLNPRGHGRRDLSTHES